MRPLEAIDNWRPVLGMPTCLVYRECPCGDWIATAEGAAAPICERCGGHFVPGGGTPDNPAHGPTLRDSRRTSGLGFIAHLMREGLASERVRDLRLEMGYEYGAHYADQAPTLGHQRYYTPQECQDASERIKSKPH